MDRVNDAMSDPYRLARFVAAQDQGGTYERAVAELRAGAKVSHWMWFVFPQVAGLGMSAISQEFAISSAGEARAYLAHPVLGPRLRECARVVAGTEGRTAERIFGPVDAVKLRSSMTLFAAVDGQAGENVFRAVLAKYYGGVADDATLSRLLAGAYRVAGAYRAGERAGLAVTRSALRQAGTTTRSRPVAAPLPWESPRGLVSVNVSNTTGAGNGLATVAAGVW
jgi:uncharacterized protein (DUF1810 family)